MYNEKSFKTHIFWMKVKRVFLILLFAVVGAIAGILLRDVLTNVLFLNASYGPLVIVGTTLIMIALAFLLTAGTGRAVQDAYWKMALLRKVIVISKKLDNVSIVANDELDEMIDSINEIENVSPKKTNVNKREKVGVRKEG